MTQRAELYEIGTPLPAALKVSRAELPEDVLKAIRPLMRPDPRGYFLQWLAAWLSIVVAIGAAIHFDNVYLTAAVIFFVATRQNLLALLMHEQTHWLGSRSNWADYFCELLVAYPPMVTLEG